MNDNAAPARPSILRRFFSWLFSWRSIRAAFILGIVLVTLWGLFWSIENVRGEKAWAQTRKSLQDRGERLSYTDFVPPEVPDDQNLAMTPLLKPLLDWTTGPGARPRDTNAYEAVRKISVTVPDASNLTSMRDGKRTDLEAWRKALAKSTNMVVKQDGKSPSADILEGLKAFSAQLDELNAAAARPNIRFPLRWENGAEILLPHLGSLKTLANVLVLRSICLLDQGRSEEALRDLQTAFRLGEAGGKECFLICYLVQIAIDSLATQPVWEGIQSHRWTETQLQQIQATLAARDYMEGARKTIRTERAVLVNTEMERMVRDPSSIGKAMALKDPNPSQAAEQEKTLQKLFSVTPRGWIRQNQVHINLAYQQLIDAIPKREESHTVNYQSVEATLLKELSSGFYPYKILARMLIPAIRNSIGKSQDSEAWRIVVLTGCSFERHRIKHGAYPKSLADLDPALVVAPPVDPYTGSQLILGKWEDGTLAVYSVGEDRKDDGGTIESPDSKSKKASGPRYRDVIFTLPAK